MSIEATKICHFVLKFTGIGSQPARFSDVLNLKNFITMWGIKLLFLLLLKLQKISYYFGLCHKKLLANQFAWFFSFDLFDLLILIIGVHCYIVFVSFAIPTIKECLHLRHLQLGPTKCVSQKCSKLIGITWLV